MALSACPIRRCSRPRPDPRNHPHSPAAPVPPPLPDRCRGQSVVRCLVPVDHVSGDPPPVTHRKPPALRPGTDLCAPLAVCRGAAAPMTASSACVRLPRVCRVLLENVIELVTVLLAQVDLVAAPVKAEGARPFLASRDLFLVIVTCVRDQHLLCHWSPPSPVNLCIQVKMR